MLALIQFHLVTLIAALLVGVATGWWVFHGRTLHSTDRGHKDSRES